MDTLSYIEVPRWVREAFYQELKPHDWYAAMNNPIVGLRNFVARFAQEMEAQAVHLIGNTCQLVRVQIELAPPLLNHVMKLAFPHPSLPRQLAIPLVEGLYSAAAFEFPCGIEGYHITLTAQPVYILMEDGQHIPVTRPEMKIESLIPMHIDLTAPPRVASTRRQTYRIENFGASLHMRNLTASKGKAVLSLFGAQMARAIEAGEAATRIE